MDLNELMKNYAPVYPNSHQWADTFQVFSENTNDMAIVQDLVSDLLKDGRLREPVTLSTPEDEDEEYQPFVKNGTHRIYAHHLAGIRDVYVHHGWVDTTDETVAPLDDYDMVVTFIKFQEALADELLWEISDAVRSFKVSDELWFESSSMSFEGDQYMTLIWSQNNTLYSGNVAELVENNLVARISRHSANTENIVTRHVATEQEYNDFELAFKALY